MYGAGTKLLLATHSGVDCFLLDDEIGHFILSHPNLRVPATGQEYSVNEVGISSMCVHMHSCMHVHPPYRLHAHTHTHAHTLSLFLSLSLSLSLTHTMYHVHTGQPGAL